MICGFIVCVHFVCSLCVFMLCVCVCVCVFPPDTAAPPEIKIYGERRVGESVSVHCSVVHTCPTFPPTLKLNFRSEGSAVTHDSLQTGLARTTLTASLLIESVHQRVDCSVHHHGGLEATASESIQAECKFTFTFYIEGI